MVFNLKYVNFFGIKYFFRMPMPKKLKYIFQIANAILSQ